MGKYDGDEIDPDDPIRKSVGPKAAARIAIMEQVRAKYLTSDRDDAISIGVEFLIEQLVTRADPKAPPTRRNRREGRVFLVLGKSGAGKSTALERRLGRHDAFPGYGVKGSGCPLVTVGVPGPCALAQLGRQLLAELGYPLVSEKKADMVWEMVRAKVAALGVRVIHFDDIQNVTKTANIKEAVQIKDTLKSLMNDKNYPVCLILSGLPEVGPFLGKDFQNLRRARRLVFQDVSPDDYEDLGENLATLAGVAKLTCDAREIGEIVPRLAHAAVHQMGYAIETACDAINQALKRSARRLTIDDFAIDFAQRSGWGEKDNPFVSPNWGEIDYSALWEDDADGEAEDASGRSSPKRKAKAAKPRIAKEQPDDERGF